MLPGCGSHQRLLSRYVRYFRRAATARRLRRSTRHDRKVLGSTITNLHAEASATVASGPCEMNVFSNQAIDAWPARQVMATGVLALLLTANDCRDVQSCVTNRSFL